MNWPLAILVLLVVVGLVALIWLTVVGTRQWKATSIISIRLRNKCAPPFETLPDITELNCCYVGGQVTPNRYFPLIDMVIGPVASPYQEACSGFCTNQVDPTDPSRCLGGLGQAEFTACLNRLRPVGCLGLALPVGVSGTTYYYGLSATNQACLDQRPCA